MQPPLAAAESHGYVIATTDPTARAVITVASASAVRHRTIRGRLAAAVGRALPSSWHICFGDEAIDAVERVLE